MNCMERNVPCIMSAKGTGTCVTCAGQKKKCSKTLLQACKVQKAVEESSRDTSEDSQGHERADTLHMSMSALQKLSVMDAVENQPSQRAMWG